MQKKIKTHPAQRLSNGELVFWQPRVKGAVVVNYQQAQLEMARKFGRKAPEPPVEEDFDEDFN